MAITEKELLDKLHDAEIDAKEASSAMADYKDRWLAAETKLIGANIRIARIKEQLRILSNTKPTKEVSHRDEDIESFRKRFPELCEVWGVWDSNTSSWCLLDHSVKVKKERAEQAVHGEHHSVKKHCDGCLAKTTKCCVPES